MRGEERGRGGREQGRVGRGREGEGRGGGEGVVLGRPGKKVGSGWAFSFLASLPP